MKHKRQMKLRSTLSLVLAAALVFGLWPGGPNKAAAAVTAGQDTLSVAPVTELQNGNREDFIMGADVSELYALEQSGKKFYDTDGTEMSALAVMQKHGVNYIRLRVWNDPTDKFGNPVGGGNTDLASAIATAKEAKKLGMGVLLDFHYSDFWADPGSQVKPKAWLNDTGAVLQQDVYDFTYQSLQQMKAEDALPDMVQIGNEINSGMLHPDGNSATKAAPFLQKASQAVRAADPDIQIMIHLAGNSGGSASSFTGNFDTWTTGATAVDFDIIGISDYPFWHGTMAQNKTILETLATRYSKKVAVAETSYGWTLEEGDEQLNTFGQTQATAAGYTATPQGQAAEVRDIINNVASVSNNRGAGVFYWGADWLPGVDTGWITGQGSGWENQALFDYNGKALPSLDVFNLVRGSEAAPAAVLTGTDTLYASTVINVQPTLPASVPGQYSDGYYKPAAVTSWNYATIDLTKQGVYTVYGTVNGDAAAAKAIVTVGPAQPVNRIASNPGFESGSTGWTVTSPLTVKSNAGDAHAGSYALHFSSTTTAKTAYRTLTGLENGTYTYSIWAEAYGVTAENADVFIYATGYDSTNPADTVKTSVTMGGWGTWKQYSVTVPVTSGQVTLGVSVKGSAGLYGDFDDSYFGLPAEAGDGSTVVQGVTASTVGGSVLADGAVIPAGVQYIQLTTSTPGARIYYTTDGGTPAYASGSSDTQYYSEPIAIQGNTVLKAYATAPGYTSSEVASYTFTAGYSNTDSLVPDGDFEQAGVLDQWELEGAVKGNNEGVYTFEANNKSPYAGANAFNYYSAENYSFGLSQLVSGLPNGKYILAAYASGQTNITTGSDGRYTNNPAVATLTLGGITSAQSSTVNVLNQGWNIWQPYAVQDLLVTDGTLYIFFNGTASAAYWGYLDHITLTKTGDYQSGTISGTVRDNTGAAVAGAQVTVAKEAGTYGSAVSDESGNYSISGVLEGTDYTVTAVKAGYSDGIQQDIAASAASPTEGIDLLLTGRPAVDSITLNTEDIPAELNTGDTFALTAAVGPAEATIKRVLFSSSDPGIARVTSVTYNELDGTTQALVRALRAGEATITATAADGGRTAEAHFTIVGPDVPGSGDTDKTALHAAIVAAQQLIEADYTPESWSVLLSALSTATLADADESAAQSTVDEALASLEAAIAALVNTEGPGPDLQAPGGVRNAAVDEGNGYLRVSWQDPADADLSAIRVVAVSDDVYLPQTIGKGIQTAVFTGLNNGQTYQLYVHTIDSHGNVSAGIELAGTPFRTAVSYTPAPVVVTVPVPKATTVILNNITAAPKPDASGLASVTVTEDDMKLALQSAGSRQIIITAKPGEGTQSVSISLPLLQLLAAAKAGAVDTLKLDTGNATLLLSTELLLKQAGSQTQLQLLLKQSGTTGLPDSTTQVLAGAPVYDFSLTADGKQLDSFNGSSDLQVQFGYTLKPGENSHQVVVYYVQDNGQLEVVKNSRFNAATATVSFAPKHFSKYAAAYANVSYNDIAGAAWATDSINALSARGIVRGVGAESFNPSGSVTRAEFITMLMNAFDLTETGRTTSLKDVQEGTWYYDAVATAQSLGITGGRTDGTFGVNDPVSRQDMAVLAYKAAALLKDSSTAGTSLTFTDNSAISGYALEAVKAMSAAGMIQGTGNGLFAPMAATTRAQAAVIVYRLYEAQ